MQHRPTVARIDLAALAHNLRETKKFVGDDLLYMAVVKADAYGHGAVECARALEAEDIDWFGVAITEEGIQLREAGITKPILCLGSFWPGQEKLIIENRLTPVIFDIDIAAGLSRELGDTSYDIHVKIDTGMGRVGFRWDETVEFARGLKAFPNLNLVGIMTHLASADDPSQDEFTRKQIERFKASCEALAAEGFDPQICDIANSPGSIRCPDSRADMIRLGGALYGLLNDILPPNSPSPTLKPVLSLVSRIAHLKRVPSGEGLGYGQIFHTQRDSTIALVPIGYDDGYPRGESNRQNAIVNGQLAAVIGRVSMDWTLLDVTDVTNCIKGDEV
ncbi:MAG TPA: alanine racemase, partial [Pyrinomonadaceae bacterium]